MDEDKVKITDEELKDIIKKREKVQREKAAAEQKKLVEAAEAHAKWVREGGQNLY